MGLEAFCPVRMWGASVTQHREAGQEGALGSARAGFKCLCIYLLRGICVPGIGLGSGDIAVNKLGPALLGMTFQYGKTDPDRHAECN